MNKKTPRYSIKIFIFASVIFIIGVGYVTWRWIFTLNLLTSPFTTFWSYALLAAEIVTLIVFTNFSMILVKAAKLKKTEPDNVLQQDYSTDIFKNGELVTFKNFCPSVDIFICTLNEPADLLASTISACKNIDYPNKKVYVLDDGRRNEIKELAELLGCNYITRNTNKGFKSGNINNGLSQTDSDIVVIFDADHMPASTFLRETVYFFTDENLAMVQTPQHFCNPDAFQKNLRMEKFLSNEQEMFYRIIEPALNEYGSVFCGGTNILIRRSHLAFVGNFPENSITEDSLLGLKLHAAGYGITYYNRPIAIGLAASTFEEYIKQRCRWAKGNVQILTTVQNWKYYKSLTPVQTFFYLSGVMYFITPIARIIFLLAPVLFLFFDITPVLILFYQIFAFQICYFTIKFAFIFNRCIRVKNVVLADVYDLVTSIFTVGSILQALFLPEKLAKFKFHVTHKTSRPASTGFKYSARLAVIFGILVAAELQGIYDLLYSEVYSVLAVVANLFWNSINIVVLFFGIQAVTEKPEKRTYQRVDLEKTINIEDEKHKKYRAVVEDASRSGLKFSANENLEQNTENEFTAKIENEDNPLKILNCSPKNGKYICKSMFKKPVALFKLTRQNVNRLDNYVKFAYKKPDKWDDYFED